MFLDIRVTLATFVTAVGLALVMFAVGTRAWVGYDLPAGPRIEVRALAAPEPIERGFGVSPAVERLVAGAPAAASADVQGLLPASKTEPTRPAERATSREAPAPVVSSVMPGAGAVVQERFDVLHEPSAQIVPPRIGAVGGPLVPLPRPRAGEPAATSAAASIAAPEQADQAPPRPKASVGSAKRAETSAAKKRPREASSYFGGLFGR